MKMIQITTHYAVAWTRTEEGLLKSFIRDHGSDLHRLHNLAYGAFPYRERESVRRKVYRLRMDREYITTVNNVRAELLGV